MLALVGIIVVLSAVAGGFLLERGNFLVLVQPSELLIIVGSAAGITLVANSPAAVLNILKSALSVFTQRSYSKNFYSSVLKMLYELFNVGRRLGMPALENHIDNADSSQLFTSYAEFTEDEGAMTFLCDSLRMVTSGIARPRLPGTPLKVSDSRPS